MSDRIPTFVLGGSGYVAGELLRLLAAHPNLELAGAVSESNAGARLGEVFGNLNATHEGQRFMGRDALLERLSGRAAVFSAAPHGASAGLVAEVLARADASGAAVTVVDASADFRFREANDYEAVYGEAHAAPELLPQFFCAVPEHAEAATAPHVGHPGCFATAMLIAAVPLIAQELVEPELFASGITGSTGAGRTPADTTHHPVRHSNLFAYKPLSHRHAPEVMSICERLAGIRPRLHFVPHSGPFARGIHLTLNARLRQASDARELHDVFAAFYARSHFVRVLDEPPRLKDVVASNYAHLSVAVRGDALVVFVVIDNLVKGAAGGAIQWMNRLLGLEETAGLALPGPAWV